MKVFVETAEPLTGPTPSHTPGQWAAFTEHGEPCRYVIALPESGLLKDGTLIADCLCAHGCMKVGIPLPDENEAERNAWLIAAAPGLLSACRQALCRFSNIPGDHADVIDVLVKAIDYASRKRGKP